MEQLPFKRRLHLIHSLENMIAMAWHSSPADSGMDQSTIDNAARVLAWFKKWHAKRSDTPATDAFPKS